MDKIRSFIGIQDELSTIFVIQSNLKEMFVWIVSNMKGETRDIQNSTKDGLIFGRFVNIRHVDHREGICIH